MGERACIGSRGTCAAAWSCCPTRWPTSTSDEALASRQLPQYHPFSLLTQNQTSTTSTLLATVEPAMTTTAACAVERRMQAMAVWPSPPGAISTLSTPSTRPTALQEEWEEARSVSRQADKFFRRRTRKVFFQLLSTTPPSVCSASSLSITLARDGWWWWSKSPRKPPPLPKKKKKKKKKKK